MDYNSDLNLYYVPDVCRYCKKLNANQVEITSGSLCTDFENFRKFAKKNPLIIEATKAGANIPTKLFFSNGYYR